MRTKFTAGRVSAFQCPEGKSQSFLWDTESKGLGLKASPGGGKKYIWQGRLVTEETIRVTIGDPLAWSITEAQAEARRLQTLADQGMDPREQKREQARATAAAKIERKRQGITLGEIWPIYVTANSPRWSAAHLRDHHVVAELGGRKAKRGNRLIVPGVLATMLPLQICEITPQRVKAWLAEEALTRPTQARLAFGLLRACINWCEREPEYKGLAAPDACSGQIRRDTLPKKAAKDDCLQREQLPSWFKAVIQLQNHVISAYLQTLLLTGARREELAGLQWADVDFRWNSLTIRDKVEGQRTIPLTPYVAQLLGALPHRNEWVFSSPTAQSGRLQEPRIAHNKALDIAGLPALSLHGLRRSFGTLCEWIEMPAGISAQIMGHKPSALAEKHYRRRPLDLLRLWHTKIEAWILEQANISQPTNAIPTGLHAVK